MRFSSANTGDVAKTEAATEELLMLLMRLMRHRGYSCDAIVSAQLKRCFPDNRLLGPTAEVTLRLQFAKLKLEPKAIAYLTDNVTMELHMAHERTVG
jgi:hypothetical protein